MNNLDDIKKKIRPILKKYGIKKAGILGSTTRGESVANDLDLLVKIDKKISLLEFIEIKQELEDELGMKVDLVEYDAIKPALKDDILKNEVPIFEEKKSDLQDYINERKKRDPEFAEGYDEGLRSFKNDVMEELIEAERQIARGEVVSHEEAKKQLKETLAKWK